MKRFVTLFVLPALAASAAAQATIHVPGEVGTIQGAIALAHDGDTVRVAPGTYHEVLDYLGKAIAVESEAGAASTTIDATGLFETVVSFHSMEGPGSVLRGFTVTGGDSSFQAGGISTTLGPARMSTPRIEACVVRANRTFSGRAGGVTGSPTLVDCVIEGNSSSFDAGGVWGAPVMQRCIVRDNRGYDGGGIHLSGGRAEDCRITGNVAQEGTRGGGVYLEGANVVLFRCLIARNTAASAGMYPVASAGVYVYSNHGAPLLVGCTIVDNFVYSPYVPPGEDCGGIQGPLRLVNSIVHGNDGLEIGSSSSVQAAFSDIRGGYAGVGNFDLDPLFVDPMSGDYHLAAGSPCIDTGTPTAPLDPDCTRADVGAFYYAQANAVVRNGLGVNPLVLQSVTPPAIGTIWTARIDARLVPGSSLSAIYGTTRALEPGLLLRPGELLVDGARLFWQVEASPGITVDFFFRIPNRAALVGREAHAQAIVLGRNGLVLGNALHLKLGH